MAETKNILCKNECTHKPDDCKCERCVNYTRGQTFEEIKAAAREGQVTTRNAFTAGCNTDRKDDAEDLMLIEDGDPANQKPKNTDVKPQHQKPLGRPACERITEDDYKALDEETQDRLNDLMLEIEEIASKNHLSKGAVKDLFGVIKSFLRTTEDLGVDISTGKRLIDICSDINHESRSIREDKAKTRDMVSLLNEFNF